MEAFTTHTGIGVPLRQSNVDTDQIIPRCVPQAHHAHWLRGRFVRCLAEGRVLHP